MINTYSSGISSAFQQGVSGLHKSSGSIIESANQLVSSGTLERAVESTDIVEPLIKIQQQQQVFDASAKVVDIADQALGALIDTNA